MVSSCLVTSANAVAKILNSNMYIMWNNLSCFIDVVSYDKNYTKQDKKRKPFTFSGNIIRPIFNSN